MPTVEENHRVWSNYNWSQSGDEWSQTWGSTEFLWWGSLFPRLVAFLPSPSILEIAPGHGRFTHYLRHLCNHLTIVDLTDVCIEACKKRFANSSNISYFTNDGKSLDMVADHSIDFVFSFDSLVHAEDDVIEAYLLQLSKKLKPNGVGFIHHSNIGEYINPETNELSSENTHWRAKSMTAEKFSAYCDAAGLQCISQEIVAWGADIMNDCISVFTPQSSKWARPNRITRNDKFIQEATNWARLQPNYHFPQDSQKFEQHLSQLPKCRERLKNAKAEIETLNDTINAMESSKFWQLRKRWFKLRRLVGLPGQE